MGDSLVILLILFLLGALLVVAIIVGVVYLFKFAFKVFENPKYGLYIILIIVAAILFLAITVSF